MSITSNLTTPKKNQIQVDKLPPISVSPSKSLDRQSYRSKGFQSKSLCSSSVHSPEDPMIKQFKNTNNPFLQGYTRTDKIRYKGSPTVKPHTRLFEYCTISSFNLSHTGVPPPLSQQVKGVPNIRQSFVQNKLMKEIVEDQDVICSNEKLERSIESLWKMNLLQDKQVRMNFLPKNQSISYVYNDYHSRSTNPGYARNDKSGTFFTR